MILITGGLGFLGGRIANQLVLAGLNVRISTTREDVEVPKVLSSCEIVHTNYNNIESLELACCNVSIVLHLAGINSINSEYDPEKALLLNGLGTFRLLKAAEKNGVLKFLYFSTIHIYGNPLGGEIDEGTLPRPINHYSISNRLAEDFVMQASNKGKISGAVVRLSNAFGKPIDKISNCWTLVVNDLCLQAVKHQKLNLNTDGQQLRDFIPVADVCDAIEFLIKLPEKKFNSQVFNLGSQTYTIYEIAKLIGSRALKILGLRIEIKKGKKSEIIFMPKYLKYSTNKLKNLGFKSKKSFSSEIDELLKFCVDK